MEKLGKDIKTVLQVFLWLLCIFAIVAIIIVYVKLKLLIKQNGEQLRLIIQKEKFGKEGFAVIPSQLSAMASKYNKIPNQMLPTAQAEDWCKSSQPPWSVVNNDRYGPQPWLQSNYAGKYGSNVGTASAENAPDLGANSAPLVVSQDNVSNEISGLANPNLDVSQAETSVLNVTEEDAKKAGRGQLDNMGFVDNQPVDSAGPVITQTGVNPEGFAAKEMFTMNTRACPPTICSEHFMVDRKYSRGNISSNPEGFRPRVRYQ